MSACHLVVGDRLSAGGDAPGSVVGNPSIPIKLTEPEANTALLSATY